VLKVNGENTLFKQKLPNIQCRKWILGKGDKQIDREVPITGYQVDDNSEKTFRIAPPDESKALEALYGREVGLISMVVFREERNSDPPPKDLPPDVAPTLASVRGDTEAENDLAATFGKFNRPKPGDTPRSPEQAKSRLRGQVASLNPDLETQGVITDGAVGERKITTVPFKPSPTPVMSATITYYNKR
jgi:hypothetical protein